MFDDGDHVIGGYHFEDDDFKSGAGQDVVEVKDASLTMVRAKKYCSYILHYVLRRLMRVNKI